MRSLPAGLGAQLSPDDEVIALLLLLGSSGRLTTKVKTDEYKTSLMWM